MHLYGISLAGTASCMLLALLPLLPLGDSKRLPRVGTVTPTNFHLGLNSACKGSTPHALSLLTWLQVSLGSACLTSGALAATGLVR